MSDNGEKQDSGNGSGLLDEGPLADLGDLRAYDDEEASAFIPRKNKGKAPVSIEEEEVPLTHEVVARKLSKAVVEKAVPFKTATASKAAATNKKQIPVDESEEEESEEEAVEEAKFSTTPKRTTEKKEKKPEKISGNETIYRETLRNTMKDDRLDPKFHDLWQVYGFFLDQSSASAILTDASQAAKVDLFNEENGTDFEPINKAFTNVKIGTSTLKKGVKIARILAHEVSRMMAFRFLQNMLRKNGRPVFEDDYDISEAFIKFIPNGPKFKGNVRDSEKVAEAAGIQYFKPKNERSATVIHLQPPKRSETSGINKLLSATISSEENPQEVDPERKELITRFLELLGTLDNENLEVALTKFEKIISS